MLILDPSGELGYVSWDVARRLGYDSVEPLLGQGLQAHVHGDDLARYRRAVDAWGAGRRQRVRYRLRCASGSWVACESTGVNLVGDREVGGILVTTRPLEEHVPA